MLIEIQFYIIKFAQSDLYAKISTIKSLRDLNTQSDPRKVLRIRRATRDYTIFVQGTLRNAVCTRSFS